VSRITPYALMKSAVREKRSVANHVEHTLEVDMQNLNALRSQLDVKRVVEMAKRIDRAHRILVVGIDFAAPLSNLLAYGLVSIGYDAEAPVGSAGNLRQKVLLLGPKDLLVAISFGRCLQDTVDVAICARDNRVLTFGLTDSEKSPIARFCDSSWILRGCRFRHQRIAGSVLATTSSAFSLGFTTQGAGIPLTLVHTRRQIGKQELR
jgi:DNA-binding MurR/RpiR family transcriptional regulator